MLYERNGEGVWRRISVLNRYLQLGSVHREKTATIFSAISLSLSFDNPAMNESVKRLAVELTDIFFNF